jgi:dihydroorotate dehydrogenase
MSASGFLAPIFRASFRFGDPVLASNLAGVDLANPVGIAAGFDKNGHLVGRLRDFGFGFAEVGSITGAASSGNPQPRLFRLPADQAVVNRLGLNGDGAEVVGERLTRSRFSLPVAVNIAKTNDASVVGDAAIADQLRSFKAVRHLPLMYVAINASCPNTHEGCLEAEDELDAVLSAVQAANERSLPIFLKLSPDSSDNLLDEFIGVSIRHRLSGFICGNTTVDRAGLRTDDQTVKIIGNGGLSGPPLKEKALALVRRVYARKRPEQQIIGCGGISNGADAFQFIQAGASAVQVYTAFVYHGPATAATINRELATLLKQHGMTMRLAVGSERGTSNRTK